MPEKPQPLRLAYAVDDAAAALGVSPRTIRHLINRGELSYARIGRRIVIPVAELEKFLRKNRCEARRSIESEQS